MPILDGYETTRRLVNLMQSTSMNPVYIIGCSAYTDNGS